MNKLDRINGRIQRIKEERKELLKSVKNDLTSEKNHLVKTLIKL